MSDLRVEFERFSPDLPEMAAWYAPLGEGKTVITTSETANAAVKEFLGVKGARSLLFVPIFADATWWGFVSLMRNDQDQDRDEQEITLFQTLGKLIGAAIGRERRAKALSDANRIVENSSAILYRTLAEASMPLIYISENIARFGYEASQLIAAPERYKSYVHPDDLPKLLESQQRAVGPNGQPGIVEYRLRTVDGSYRWIEDHYNLI